MSARLFRCLGVFVSGVLVVSIAPPMAFARPIVTMKVAKK